jgi:hypothetical protein
MQNRASRRLRTVNYILVMLIILGLVLLGSLIVILL